MTWDNEQSIAIEINKTVNGQFVARLVFNGYPSGLDCAGSSIRESVMGLLHTMAGYRFETIQDVEDFIFKAKIGVSQNERDSE